MVSREEQLVVPVRDPVGHLSEAGAPGLVGFQFGECLAEPSVVQPDRVNVIPSALEDRDQLGDRHCPLEHLELGALCDR
ncbi:hypothetical protein [Nocardioides sp. 503]|uniref:hypothetical protein n=1 Tax=Nocardioides sp. 503 TaxID=2508326 RepID=UPI00106F3D1A|nr:hypothetical protein [Nocardioides sp. 503]